MEYLFQTERLQLRKFRASDASWLYALNADPEVMRYTGDRPFISIDAAIQFIASYSHYENHGYGRWVVETKTNSTPIGWCGLKFNDDIKLVDLGFRFLRAYWGYGYATESALSCLHFGFADLEILKIIGRCHHLNQKSTQVLTKVGMKFEESFIRNGEKWLLYKIHNPNN